MRLPKRDSETGLAVLTGAMGLVWLSSTLHHAGSGQANRPRAGAATANVQSRAGVYRNDEAA